VKRRIGGAGLALLFPIPSGCSSPPLTPQGGRVAEPSQATAPDPGYENLPARLLAVHSRERARLGIAPLVWDPALAAAASAYGKQLIPRGKLIHSAAKSRPGQGENLWMGTHARYSIERMATGWVNEKRIFRAGIFPDVSTNGKWADVGHYTQMIWRGTRRVGCALEQGSAWDYLVCRYSPAGNVVGQRVP
jgi:hypothetical protein